MSIHINGRLNLLKKLFFKSLQKPLWPAVPVAKICLFVVMLLYSTLVIYRYEYVLMYFIFVCAMVCRTVQLPKFSGCPKNSGIHENKTTYTDVIIYYLQHMQYTCSPLCCMHVLISCIMFLKVLINIFGSAYSHWFLTFQKFCIWLIITIS